jgi:MFS family permease
MKRVALKEFLGLNRNTILLLAGIVLIGSGEEMWMRFLPKHLEALGASVLVIAVFDAIKTLLGAVYAFPGGVIVDRWGHRRAFVSFILISVAGYAIVVATTSPIGVILGMFLFLAWSNLSLPAAFSLVGRSLPDHKHAMGIGMQSLLRRIPVLVGPIAGGLLMDRLGLIRGVHAAVAISIALALSALVLENALHEEDTLPAKLEWNLPRVLRQFDPSLRRLLVSDFLIRFCERIPYAWVVIYAMDRLGLTATQVGILIAIEMSAAIACYLPASYLADRLGKEPFVVATFVFFTLFPLVLLLTTGLGSMMAAFAVRGLKEFGEPARKSLIIGYAPADGRGRTIGAYYLVRDTVVTAGSFIGALLWKISPEANFAGAAMIGGVGTVFYVRSISRRTLTGV